MTRGSMVSLPMAMVLTLLAACTAPAPSRAEVVAAKREREQRVVALLKHIGMSMPPAVIEYYELHQGMDEMAEVILVVSRKDWIAMRNAPPLSTEPDGRWRQVLAETLPADHGAWRPQQDPGIIAAQIRLPNAEFVDVGYSPAGPDRVRVYLSWSQT